RARDSRRADQCHRHCAARYRPPRSGARKGPAAGQRIMAEFKVDPAAVHAFKDAAALWKWYEKNHASKDELWIKLAKKGSGVASVTNVEALDAALCWGWIDAIRKSLDETYFLQRYTKRKKTSTWSKVNIGHVDRLRKEGRMQPSGEAEVKRAQEDGRWDKA